MQPLFSGNRQFPRPLLLRGACGEYRRKKTITLTDEMADASIGMEMNTYTIGSGMSGENLLEKDYAVMNLDTYQRIELGWISRRDHELSNFGKRFLALLIEKLHSMQLD